MFRCEVPPWAVKLPAFTSCKSKRCWFLQGELWRILTSKCATWKSLLSSHPNLEKPHKLPLEMPQFLTFKIPENLLLCFCAYPEVLSLGTTDEKCFILTKVLPESPSCQEAQPDQAFLETASGIPQRYLWQMCSTGCCFPWKCAQSGLTSEYSHSYGRHIQLTSPAKAVQAHLVPRKEVQNFLVSYLQPSDRSEIPFKIPNSYFWVRLEFEINDKWRDRDDW